jgi:lysophospholipase L1-like esterase
LDDRQTSSYILQCKLEDLLKIPVEVINTGVSGIAALNHLSTLNKIENYYPNLVIIMMGANDWNKQVRNHFKQSIYFFNMIRSKYQFEISPLYKLFKQIFWHFYRINSIDKLIDHGEYYSIQNNSLKRAIRREYRPQNVSNEFSIYTKAIFNKCLQGKFKTLVVAQITSYKDNASDELKRYYWCTPPNEYYTLDFANMVYLANLYNVFVENEARHYGLPFCKTDNIPPTTEAFYDDMHLNSRGANIFADIIYQSILKNSLL